MKKSFLFIFSYFIVAFSINAQNANPYVSILLNPYEVVIKQTTSLQVSAGNASNDKIAPNSLRLTIKAGTNATITGLSSKSDPRWKMVELTKGNANTIILTNSGKTGIGSFDLSQLIITVEGTSLGGPDTFVATIAYNAGNSSSGKSYASQGNSSAQDDRSTTSLIVLAEEKPKRGF